MVRIAVQGCCHGELNNIYAQLPPVDLLLICGDFQAIRNEADFDSISVPRKYRALGDFHQYYNGERTAPVLTIFIGGNHESSLYMKELKFGGWAAPNIYFLGEYGSVWFRGLHITGWSGIFNRETFLHSTLVDESLPYSPQTLRSVYHSKPKNYLKMLLLLLPDIVLSHDWPQSIEQYGDTKKLLREKKFFREDIEHDLLGSPLNKVLLMRLKPRYWFSSHLHVRFTAEVVHEKNRDEIELDMDDMGETTEEGGNTRTEFLALDKCLPKRKHLEVVDIEGDAGHFSYAHPGLLFYDPYGIAVNRVVEEYVLTGKLDQIDMHDVLANVSNFHLVDELRSEVERLVGRIEGRMERQGELGERKEELVERVELGEREEKLGERAELGERKEELGERKETLKEGSVTTQTQEKSPRLQEKLNHKPLENSYDIFDEANSDNSSLSPSEPTVVSPELSFAVPDDFVETAPAAPIVPGMLRYYKNEQTERFCAKFKIPFKPLEWGKREREPQGDRKGKRKWRRNDGGNE